MENVRRANVDNNNRKKICSFHYKNVCLVCITCQNKNVYHLFDFGKSACRRSKCCLRLLLRFAQYSQYGH